MMADKEIVPEEEAELIVPDVKEEVKKEDSVVELSTGGEDTQKKSGKRKSLYFVGFLNF
jgi:hypothetical protein